MTHDPPPLTSARFAALAEAYGGSIGRWPEAVRDEARRMAGDPAMQAILAEADALDAHLDAWRMPAPSLSMRARVAGSWRRPLSRRARLWWSGLGIATALAGAAAGSVAAAAALPGDPAATAEDITAFGNLAGQEI